MALHGTPWIITQSFTGAHTGSFVWAFTGPITGAITGANRGAHTGAIEDTHIHTTQKRETPTQLNNMRRNHESIMRTHKFS